MRSTRQVLRRGLNATLSRVRLSRQSVYEAAAGTVIGTMSTLQVENLFNVRGMIFVITGGGSGLGEMMALALDANGASKVFVLGSRKASLEKVAGKAVSDISSVTYLGA